MIMERKILHENSFSNSLIIYKEKTKEITTVTVVWIPGLNYHKILRAFALNFPRMKPYQTLERMFCQVSKHLEVGQKKLGCPSFFQPTSLGLDILMKHSFSCLIYYVKSSCFFVNYVMFLCGNKLTSIWRLNGCNTVLTKFVGGVRACLI